jgi:membrane-associated phospholipid phosphatase
LPPGIQWFLSRADESRPFSRSLRRFQFLRSGCSFDEPVNPLRLLLFAAGALLCALSFHFDEAVIAWVVAHPKPEIQEVARFFTTWGDFPPIVGYLALGLGICWLLRRRRAMRILLTMLGCACAGGLIANILRVLTGRARPNARVAPGWYGMWSHGHWIAGSYRYSSFPSAHTAVAIACVVPLWLLLSGGRRLAIAVPATLIALCVAGSRILLDAHHLSDVLTSIWLGTLIAAIICRRWGKRPVV